ncbi:hypothetical protein BJ165DRAFT_1449854 [Panaeolus papilionaceus]|nr:hypothetical protein BJ165DRAFT_1449854 [Panaeolus papilionaceus]
MAHNSGFYPVQGQAVPVFQQPQNIYQQLGKPQPQPHLQGFNPQQPQQQPGYGYSQPTPQPQQYAQQPGGQQYPVSQTPYQSPQTPYPPPSQTPYLPSQTPYAQPQVPYAPPQNQYPGYAPQPSPQPGYAPPQHQQPSPQIYQAPIQPSLQPVQNQSRPPPSPSYALPHLKTPGPGTTVPSWRPTSSTSRPPPISPSAVLAQQVRATPQAQHPQAQIQPVIPSSPSRIQPQPQSQFRHQQQQPMQQLPPQQPSQIHTQPQQIRQPPMQQVQQPQQPQQSPTRKAPPSQVPPTPTSSGRRPLPQPAPGMVTKPPVIPAGNVMQRIQVFNKSQSVDLGKPFPNLPPASSQAGTSEGPLTRSPSPTKGRPLPGTPGVTAKRMTVDMGKLPSGLPSASFSTPTSAVSPSVMSRENSQSQAGSSSPIKSISGLPMPPSMTPSNTSRDPVGLSKTSSYAINGNKSTASSNSTVFPATPTSPTKRRASPPRFQSQPSSASGSPTKESPAWGSSGNDIQSNANSTQGSSSTFSGEQRSVSGFSTSSASSRNTASTMSSSSTVSSGAPQKFTPIWKRTIQEVPAPVWGYAAGMVSEPHPKPKPAPPPVHPVIAEKKTTKEEKKKEKEMEKDRRKLEKLSKKLGIATPPAVSPVAQSGAKPSMYSQAPQPIAQSYSAPGYTTQKPAPPQHPQHTYQLPPLSFQSRQPQQPYPQQRQLQSANPYSGHQQQYQNEGEDSEEEEEEEESEETNEDDEDEETEETEETEEEDPRYARQAHRAQMRRTQSQPHEYEYERSTPPIKGHQASASEFSQRTPTRHQPPAKKVLQPKSKHGKELEYFEERSPRASELKPSPQRKLIKLRPKNRDMETSTPSPKTKKGMANTRASRAEVEAPKKKQMRSRSAFGERETNRRTEKEVYKRPGSAFARRLYEDEEEDDYSTEHRLAYDESEDEEDDDWDVTPRRNPVQSRQQVSNGARRNQEWEDEEPVRERTGKKFVAPKEHRKQASSPQYGIRDGPSGSSHRRGASAPGSPGGRYQDEEEEELEEQHWSRRNRQVVEERRPRKAAGTGLPQPPSMVREGGMQQSRPAAVRRTTAPLKGGSDYEEYNQQPRAQPPPLPHRQSISAQGFPQGVTAMTAKFTNMAVRPDPRSESRGSTTTDMSGTTAYSRSTDSWPVNLPHLPRTPGSANTPTGSNSGSDYFGSRPGTGQPTSSFQKQEQRPVQHQAPPLPQRGRNNRRHTLNLDDPPPQASVIRTPSPRPSGYTFKENPQSTCQQAQQQHIQNQQFAQQQPAAEQRSRPLPQHAFNGPDRPATAAEQLQRRRSLYNGSQPEMRPRPQSQIYDSPHSQQGSNQPPHEFRSSPQSASAYGDQFSMQLPQGFNTPRKQPQTPAPPPTIGIESPHPIGGRDKKPDIPMLEESSNDGSDTEDRRGRHQTSTPTVHVSGDSGGYSIPTINIGDEHEPSHHLRRNAVPMINVTPTINVDSGDDNVPVINVNPPSINIENSQPAQHPNRSGGVNNNTNSRTPRVQVYEIPGVSVAGPEFEDDHSGGPSINVSGADSHGHSHRNHSGPITQRTHGPPRTGKGGLLCAGCNGAIVGRLVSAMGSRWHPSCFRCTVCNELLEHVSSYEHEGRPYCHLDYHENFAPRCYSCKTAIIEEQFISLDDPALGKRTYHTQHFYCAECGDPFLSLSGGLQGSSNGEMAVTGDGEFEGFTVYKGYPYCEACHIRLRYPKCKRCRRPIRDHDQAVEALGGKWCWGCFTCAGCEKPFEEPSFFERDKQAYCEHCFSVILRNEI